MIKVYLDYGSTTEWIATFDNEETYRACGTSLVLLAEESRAKLIESYEEFPYDL